MTHPLKGRKQSPEHVAKRVAAVRARLDEDPAIREKMSTAAMGNRKGKANKGKVHSEEQNQAHAATMTGRKQDPEMVAARVAKARATWNAKSPEEIALWLERKQKASYKPTNIERWLHVWLDDQGISFVIHPWVRVNHGGVKRVLRPDVLLPAQNLVVEVQGCYWHGCTDCYGEKARVDRIVEDEVRRSLMEEQGYKVFELWEHDIKSGASPTLLLAVL